MTIEAAIPSFRHLLPLAKAAAAALVLWFGGLAAFTVVAEPTSAVFVLDPGYRTVPVLSAAGGSLAGALGPFVQVRKVHRGFVAGLYRRGALLVLPLPTPGGCLALSSAERRGPEKTARF